MMIVMTRIQKTDGPVFLLHLPINDECEQTNTENRRLIVIKRIQVVMLHLPINGKNDQTKTSSSVLKHPPETALLYRNLQINLIKDVLWYFPVVDASGHFDDLFSFLLPVHC
jgi:hypothetical protein